MADAAPAPLVSAAHAALARGALDDAARLVAELERIAPADPNTAFVAGVLAYRRERYDDAAAKLARAQALAPNASAVTFWLGNAERRRGALPAAAAAFRNVLAAQPTHRDAAFNLGLTAAALGEFDEAGAAFVRCARLEPASAEAMQGLVDAAAALAQRGVEAPESHSAGSPAPLRGAAGGRTAGRPLVSFVVCSITPGKLAALEADIAVAFADPSPARRDLDASDAPGTAWELVHVPDATSLAEGYTRGLARSRGDVVVFCHDDIALLAPDFAARLLDALDGADVVGVAGATRLTGPTLTHAGAPHVHGWVTHVDASGTLLPSVLSVAGPRIDGAQALDGVFLAMRRDVAGRIGFDAATFDGFHLYDLDFAYRAHRAGLRVRIACDLLIAHASLGRYDDAFARHAAKFGAKFPELDARAASSARAYFFQAPVASVDAVRRFYGWIAHWLRTCPIAEPPR